MDCPTPTLSMAIGPLSVSTIEPLTKHSSSAMRSALAAGPMGFLVKVNRPVFGSSSNE